MKQGGTHESEFDVAAGRFLDGFAQRVSRRGILARIGKLALSLMGVALVPHLPIDRTFVVEAQSTDCDDWRLCGIHGFLCKACCDQGEQLYECPQCTNTGGSWSSCCTKPSDNCQYAITYTDCCSSATASIPCTGKSCNNNPNVNRNWCDDLGAFRCTVITVGPKC
jgi:hypothetical protein